MAWKQQSHQMPGGMSLGGISMPIVASWTEGFRELSCTGVVWNAQVLQDLVAIGREAWEEIRS